MEKLGIFGGTFNPPHNEHIRLARAAVKALSLDKLVVMPTFIPPHKEVSLAPAEERLEMLELCFSEDEKIEVSDLEIARGGKSYTYETVEHYKKEGREIYFIVGGDMLADFKTWRYPERILAAADLAAFGRDGFKECVKAEEEYFLKTFGKSFTALSYAGEEVSSTEIRVYNSLGLDIAAFTDGKVAEYIKSHDLYSGGNAEKFVKNHLPQKRLIHTANVAVCALKKAKELGLSEEKVLTAAVLHDCAKYMDKDKVKGFVLPEGVPEPVVHSFLGAYVAEHVVGVKDEEILDAIRYHTSGKPEMTALGKLIFVADMIEKGRDYDGVEKLRALYDKDLDTCFKECLKEEVLHLLNKKSYIYKATLDAYNYYINDERV